MNASGTAVGNVTNTAGAYYPVRWSPTGVPTLLSSAQGTAFGINDSGVIVGNTSTSPTTYVPTVWDGSSTLNLLTGTSDTIGEAGGITNAGKIVGWVQTTGFFGTGPHAATWTITG